jgi:hypothetical protein
VPLAQPPPAPTASVVTLPSDWVDQTAVRAGAQDATVLTGIPQAVPDATATAPMPPPALVLARRRRWWGPMIAMGVGLPVLLAGLWSLRSPETASPLPAKRGPFDSAALRSGGQGEGTGHAMGVTVPKPEPAVEDKPVSIVTAPPPAEPPPPPPKKQPAPGPSDSQLQRKLQELAERLHQREQSVGRPDSVSRNLLAAARAQVEKAKTAEQRRDALKTLNEIAAEFDAR